MRWLMTTSILFLIITHLQCARILGVFPMVSNSHYILGSSLMRGLAERGHDVTVISPFGEKNPPKAGGTYTDIVLTGFKEINDDMSFNLFELDSMNPLLFPFFMNYMGSFATEMMLNHTNVQKLLKSDAQFDVVILEQFLNDAEKVLAYHFKAPLILFSTFASNAWVNPLVGNPAPPSIVPEQMITFSHKSFYDRLKNFIIYITGELNRSLIFFPAQNRLVQKYFPGAPDLKDMLYNASLLLVNSHVSTNQAVPRVPCMIDIGGFHVKPPKKLPNDLQNFLDNAKEGVIYFSMGSTLKSVDLADEKRDALLKTFSKLKMQVLWKWEDDVLPGQPHNVKLGKWLPQQDILPHPNIKLFITHGGLLSLTEAVYHGVPVLSIPIFGDQKMNAGTVAENGYGLTVAYSELTEQKLTETINEMLTNPKYRENVQRRSRIMHDRPRSPMDEADYWIQYVIRHQGAPHLRVQSLDLMWYQYLSLDVLLALIIIVLLGNYVLFAILKKMCSKCCKKSLQKIKTN